MTSSGILRRVWPLIALGIPTYLSAQQTPVQTIRFVHGQWFDGTTFRRGDFYSIEGVLSTSPPPRVDETVDLHDGFVIPPFGDAHEHNFDSLQQTPAVTRSYLSDGIFYAQGLTDVLDDANAVVAAHLVDTPETVDVTYAHGGLTGVDGHPKEVYESIALGFFYPTTDAQRKQVIESHRRAGQAYWEIDSADDLTSKWPRILATKPDLIKIYLSNSEHYTQENHLHPALGGGLDQALVPLIVQHAHAAGLKVAAHVDTAADLHVALLGGVDELAHLPGYCLDKEDPAIYRITDADITYAAIHHVTAIPTASICDNDNVSAPRRAAIRKLEIDNIGRLKAAAVNLVIGSDHYGRDSLQEAGYLHGLGLWTNLEFLRMWAVATPLDIVLKKWPERRIGKLAPGYEASFLVLTGNPLDDWSATSHIDQRWKQGRRLTLLPQTLH